MRLQAINFSSHLTFKRIENLIYPFDVLQDHSIHIKNIVSTSRKTILDSVPDIYEKVLSGWHVIGFGYCVSNFMPDFGYFSGFQSCKFRQPYHDSGNL